MESLSLSDSDFTAIGEVTAPSSSEYDMVSSVGTSSEGPGGRADTLAEFETTSVRPSSPVPALGNSGPAHPLTIENMSLKTIDETAGGSIQKYKQLVFEGMKRKGVPFTAEAFIPASGELIGDQLPGYDALTLGGKLWSWVTKDELRIFEAQVLKELLDNTEKKLYAQNGASTEKPGNDTTEFVGESGEQGENKK
jgi:hypothetical protein